MVREREKLGVLYITAIIEPRLETENIPRVYYGTHARLETRLKFTPQIDDQLGSK